ncbi:hypothetical protein C8Q77DRAFT_107222 [Trametes polyzona]|nr:hypothetical protein C8Q77DRAFT_107222 [Trametes polyzona]
MTAQDNSLITLAAFLALLLWVQCIPGNPRAPDVLSFTHTASPAWHGAFSPRAWDARSSRRYLSYGRCVSLVHAPTEAATVSDAVQTLDVGKMTSYLNWKPEDGREWPDTASDLGVFTIPCTCRENGVSHVNVESGRMHTGVDYATNRPACQNLGTVPPAITITMTASEKPAEPLFLGRVDAGRRHLASLSTMDTHYQQILAGAVPPHTFRVSRLALQFNSLAPDTLRRSEDESCLAVVERTFTM